MIEALVQIILTILAWVVIFVLIGNCLTQLAEQVKKEAAGVVRKPRK